MSFSEPPIQADDTQPRQQPAVPNTTTLDPSWTEPLDQRNLISVDEEPQRSPLTCFLGALVMGVTACMCISVMVLSAVAGYRDELGDIQTEDAQSIVGTATVQYALALENIESGLYELAYTRLLWISTESPNYLDVNQRIQEVAMVMSYTPRPEPSPTLTLTAMPSPSATAENTATPDTQSVEALFSQAQRYINFRYYEEAIETLYVVKAIDPSYRSNEVDQLLFQAYDAQSRIYFNGTNPDELGMAGGYPGNQLSRGIYLYNLALALVEENPTAGNVNDLDGYTAYFVSRFMTARDLLAAGQNGQAADILQGLCNENCNWSYRGLTINDLLSQAQSG